MCRIMVMKGVEDSAAVLKFMKAVAPTMSQYNTDGIGYSAINSKNEMFMEKWHTNSKFLDTDAVLTKEIIEELAPYAKRLPTLNENYMNVGEVTRDDIKTVTMHTRMATCGKEFRNTHPFVDNDMSLIHNGVISNSRALGLNKISSCDSEVALQLYNNEKLNLATKVPAFQKYVDQLNGGWAFAILAKDAEGQYMLDIVRERSSLYWTPMPELGEDCVVFATTAEIIEVGVKALDLPKREKIYILPEALYHRFNAVSGEFIDQFALEESALNKPTYNYGNYNNSNKNKNKAKDQKQLVENLHDSFEEMYESTGNRSGEFSEKKEELNEDTLDVDSFYDTNEPLLDRLYDYDNLMNTSYGLSYEELPEKLQVFIKTKEESDFILFDDVLLMIEEHQATDKVEGIYKIYKDKRRA